MRFSFTTLPLSVVLLIASAHAVADWRTILKDDLAPVDDRVAAALTGMTEDACFNNAEDMDQCEWRRFDLDPSHVDPQFSGREAVLIIDVIPPAVEFLRYRNRILGAYAVSASHEVVTMPVAFDLPRTFGEIITGLASSVPIPSEELTPLLPELARLYGDHVPVVSAHGTAVFNVLADLTPSQPLVLLDNSLLTFNQATPDLFCSISDNPQGINTLRQRAERFAADLRALIEKHDIRYVNASFGFTIETVRGPWQRVCETPVPPENVMRSILEAYRPVFDALFNTPGVFTAHAALASPNDLNSPFDQPGPEFPNRLRIGSLAYDGGGVPPGGAEQPASGWNPVPADPNDADIYVNAGCNDLGTCRATRPLSLGLQYGMGRAAFPLPQSSFVTPIGLARIIDLRNLPPFRDLPFSNALIDDLLVALQTGCDGNTECRFFDPLLHGQAERFRNDFEPSADLAGLWFDPARSGHGLEIQRFGRAFASWMYTFDETGAPEWLFFNTQRYGGTLFGEVLRFTNLGTPADLSTSSVVVGEFSITFEPGTIPAHCPGSPHERASFTWTIDEKTDQWCLQPILVNGSRAAPNANGMWWNGTDDSGWGFGIYSNEVTAFRVVYYFDADGTPVWAFSQGTPDEDHFDMFQATGFCRSCPEVPRVPRLEGTFEGIIDAQPGYPAGAVSVLLNHWQRTDITPERLSN